MASRKNTCRLLTRHFDCSCVCSIIKVHKFYHTKKYDMVSEVGENCEYYFLVLNSRVLPAPGRCIHRTRNNSRSPSVTTWQNWLDCRAPEWTGIRSTLLKPSGNSERRVSCISLDRSRTKAKRKKITIY